MEDFVLDSDGYCFICSDKIFKQLPPAKLKSEMGLASSKTYSLQYLSRYLKLDMRKVFNQEGPISPQLLAKVEKAKLKAELCEDCICLTRTFSKLYRRLEKVEIEVKSCVNLIHKRFAKAEEGVADHTHSINVNGKAEIVQRLRADGIGKCVDRLRHTLPRLRIQRLTMKQINEERQKLKMIARQNNKRRSHTQTEYSERRPDNATASAIEERAVKFESQTSLPVPSDDDDDNDNRNSADTYFDYSDDIRNEDLERSVTDGSHSDNNTDHPIRFGIEKTKAGDTEMVQMSTDVDATPWKSKNALNPKTGKYKCNLCDVEFGTPIGLKYHYKSVHLKEKRKCNLCGKEFTQSSTLNRHKKTAHLGFRLKCLGCGKLFTNKQHLKLHQQRLKCGVNSIFQNV